MNGIEEMFGDMTSGPDGQWARNGYEALRKWDGRRASGGYDNDARDNKISSKDEVFKRLRFWKDSNTNGKAEKNELYTLESLGVSEIDLDYDKRYAEVDRFGNKIMMKSVVRTSDGRMHIMYDLWFRLLN